MKKFLEPHQEVFQLPENSQEYLIWIIKVGQLITKKLNSLLVPFDLTFNQASILFILKQCSGRDRCMSMHELSKILMVSLANTSGLVDRLERDGLLQRKRQEGDRRTYYLELTKKGETLVDELQGHWPPPGMKGIDDIFTALSVKDKHTFTQILLSLSQQMTDGPEK